MEDLKTLEKKRDELKRKIANINNDPAVANTASIFSRISGYYRAINLWNTGKAEEFKERKTYKL